MFGHGGGHLLHAICAYDMNIFVIFVVVSLRALLTSFDLADLVVVCRCGCWLLVVGCGGIVVCSQVATPLAT